MHLSAKLNILAHASSQARKRFNFCGAVFAFLALLYNCALFFRKRSENFNFNKCNLSRFDLAKKYVGLAFCNLNGYFETLKRA